jgi:hypothetical protein
MLYSEIIAVCSEIHIKHINTLCGQSKEVLFVDLSFEGLSKKRKYDTVAGNRLPKPEI